MASIRAGWHPAPSHWRRPPGRAGHTARHRACTGHQAPAPGQGLGLQVLGGQQRQQARHHGQGKRSHGKAAGAGKAGRTGGIGGGGSAPGKGRVIEHKAGEQTGRFCVFCLRYRYFVRGHAGTAGTPHKQGLAAVPATPSLAGTAGTKWHLSTVQNKLSTDFDQILSKTGRLSYAGHRFIVDLN